MKKVSLGLIGCGGIGNFHLNHILKMEDVALTAVCDILPERAQNARLRAGENTNVYTDYAEMLDKESFDAVFVCVPPHVHPNIELAVIAKGIHLFIQKPMTLVMKDAENVQAAIEKAGIISAVGFQDRYLNVTDEMIAFLQDKKTGLFRGAWLGGIPGVYWWQKKETCGGQIIEQNIHLFDMARLFFGEAVQVTADGGKGIVTGIVPGKEDFDLEEFSSVTLRFQNGVVGTILTGCYLTGGGRNGLDIFTNKGCAYYSLRNSVEFLTPDRRTLRIEADNRNEYDCDRTFIEAVMKNDPSKIRSPYADAVKSLKLTMAAQEALESGQTIRL